MAVKRPGGRAYKRAKDVVKEALKRISRRKSAGGSGG
jgi:hypothetical protein